MIKRRKGASKSEEDGASPSASKGKWVEDDEAEDAPKVRRAVLTQNACTRCRQKKSKCDGKRPVCGRCEKNSTECTYDVPTEGMSRMQSLRQQLDTRNEEYGRLMGLFDSLRTDSDQDATELLARMRMGESLDDLSAAVLKFKDETARIPGEPVGSKDDEASFTEESLNVSGEPSMFREEPAPIDSPFNMLQGDSWTTWATRCETNSSQPSIASEQDPTSATYFPSPEYEDMDAYRMSGSRQAPYYDGEQVRRGSVQQSHDMQPERGSRRPSRPPDQRFGQVPAEGYYAQNQ